MTHPHERALEAAARAVLQSIVKRESEIAGKPVEPDAFSEIAAIDDARAAVTAYMAALQETHALVPRDPTETMMLASRRVEPSTHWRDNIRRAWSAMIDAAPPAAQDPRP